MILLAELLIFAINVVIFAVILHVILHWLVIFDVINMKHPRARQLVFLLSRLVDPIMRPVQKYVPPVGGIDISPIVIFIGAEILKRLIIMSVV